MEESYPAAVLDGKFKFIRKIGEGTEGDVYLYQNYKGDKVVAKILKTERSK